MTANFVFRRQKTNDNLDTTLDFLICCSQKERDCSETTLKTVLFRS